MKKMLQLKREISNKQAKDETDYLYIPKKIKTFEEAKKFYEVNKIDINLV